jgi:hypothetical protein
MGKHDERDGKHTEEPTRRTNSPTLWDVSGSPAEGSLLALVQERAPDPDAWLKHRSAQHLAACEQAYRAGVTAAVSDAMLWCETYDCSPPRWLVDAVIKLEELRTTDAELDERREAMLHYDRYDAVQELAERALVRKEQLDGRPLRYLADVYARVAEHFGVSTKSIQRSCGIVEADIKAGHGAKYFQSLCRRF